jgi:hypothetical protein
MVINPGDVWIIEEATWPYSYDDTSFRNADPLAPATINLPANNFVETNPLISGFTIELSAGIGVSS